MFGLNFKKSLWISFQGPHLEAIMKKGRGYLSFKNNFFLFFWKLCRPCTFPVSGTNYNPSMLIRALHLSATFLSNSLSCIDLLRQKKSKKEIEQRYHINDKRFDSTERVRDEKWTIR